MLKQRIITALVLGSLAVWAILALPVWGFGALLLVIILLAAREWGTLLALTPGASIAYCALILILAVAGGWLLPQPGFLWVILLAAAGFWCYAVFWLVRFTARSDGRDPRFTWAATGCIVLVTPWLALLELRSQSTLGPPYVLFLFALIWVADSCAYFAGRQWGRRKLAPRISPGKSWEGAIGAGIASLVFATAGAAVLNIEVSRWPLFLLLCLVTVAFSIVGDLFESMGKRQHNVKDSGSLLPGHGGVLDRVDSLTAAAPIFTLGLKWLLS